MNRDRIVRSSARGTLHSNKIALRMLVIIRAIRNLSKIINSQYNPLSRYLLTITKF